MNKLKTLILGCVAIVMTLSSCGDDKTMSGLDKKNFEATIDGKPVSLYVLKNSHKTEVCITNYGARVVSICVPDKDGMFRDVVLGYDNVAQYADTVKNASDFGAAIGRYANRINQGKFKVGEEEIQLPQNNYGHCLHGGPTGWQYQVYEVVENTDNMLKLVMHSPDGDNNFPGNVEATVTYTLTEDNTLDIVFEATTDKETIVNMTNHSYFNLSGDPSQPGTNMVLYINADYYTPSDSTFMTTGEIKSVYGTPMNFTKRHALYESIGDTTWVDIKNGKGYDHNWCLNTYKDGVGNEKIVAASLYSPESGIYMEVFTNEPGIQCYTGNFLDGTKVGKNGVAYPRQASVCLETQKYPDSPNKEGWPSPYLKPGEKYYSHVAYKFSVK